MTYQANKKTRLISLLAAPLLFLCAQADAGTNAYQGRVLDAVTQKPIAEALITVPGAVVRTGQNGNFQLPSLPGRLAVRAVGYQRLELPATALATPATIRLKPFTPKALYLSFYGAGDARLRAAALKLIEETELNAVVIDVKGDKGMLPYKSEIALATEIGARRITTLRNLQELLTTLREKGVYTIGRVVVFKDDTLAQAKPGLAVRARDGGLWRDREQLAWVDPFRKEVWDYNTAIAVEAAKLGFDEIQFDYVRFPDSRHPVFSQPNTQENRTTAISGFLKHASEALKPYNVFLAADIFGYTLWNENDTDIGQKLEMLMPHVDYVSPMLYPSGFSFGIPGYRNPVESPYEVILRTLNNGSKRTASPAVRFRPWLQAFRDYAFDKRHFSATEIEAQIKAADDFGSGGWMLWNARNVYTADGLKKEPQAQVSKAPSKDKEG